LAINPTKLFYSLGPVASQLTRYQKSLFFVLVICHDAKVLVHGSARLCQP